MRSNREIVQQDLADIRKRLDKFEKKFAKASEYEHFVKLYEIAEDVEDLADDLTRSVILLKNGEEMKEYEQRVKDGLEEPTTDDGWY